MPAQRDKCRHKQGIRACNNGRPWKLRRHDRGNEHVTHKKQSPIHNNNKQKTQTRKRKPVRRCTNTPKARTDKNTKGNDREKPDKEREKMATIAFFELE